MDKSSVKSFFKNAKMSAAKHSPEILIGFGVAGFITTAALAVKATPKAIRLLEEAKEEKHVDKLTPLEKVKVAWKPYIPAAVTAIASIACVIGANSVNARRNAALATAYQLSTTALNEYKDKVVETIGEKKEQTIREKISKDQVNNNPISNNTVYVTGAGDSLFLEPISKRYFKSDIELLRGVVNTLNERMYSDPFGGHVPLSDFYDEIGLKRTDISDNTGWRLEEGSIKVEFHPVMCDDKNSPYYNKPCLALYYLTAPKWGYDN